MSDLTPPEQPLDDATRARMRERVRAGVASSEAPARTGGLRPWLVPLAASVAIGALVVGVVVLGGDDDDRDAGPAGPGPGTTSVPAPPTATETPTAPTAPATTTRPADPPTVPGSQESRCPREVRDVLPGAEESISLADEVGTTRFYVTADQYALCFENTEVVTVHHAKPFAGGGPHNPYEVSTDFSDDGRAATFVAGGPVPAGSDDFEVTYTFPDGGVASSATVGGSPGRRPPASNGIAPDDVFWLVVYRADDGVAALDGPITVDVRNGPPATPLDVLDTCAQANHGC